MNVPRNVLWFEALLYMSLTLDAVSVAFQDRTPKADMTAQMINVATVMAGLYNSASLGSGDEALAMGLVTRVVDDGAALDDDRDALDDDRARHAGTPSFRRTPPGPDPRAVRSRAPRGPPQKN